MPDPQYKLPDVTKEIDSLPYDNAIKDAVYDAFYADTVQDTEKMLSGLSLPNEVKNVFFQVRAKHEKGKPYDSNLKLLPSLINPSTPPAKVNPPTAAVGKATDPIPQPRSVVPSTDSSSEESGIVGGAKKLGRGLVKGAVENTAKMIYDAGKRIATPADDTVGKYAQMVAGPAGALVADMAQSQIGQFGKAYDAARSGQPLEAAGQLVAGMIPLVGPAVAHGAEKLGTAAGTGDLEGVGEAIGDIGVAVLPAMKGGKAGKAGKSGKASPELSKSPKSVTETAPPPKSAKASAAVFEDPAMIDIANAKAKAKARMADKKKTSPIPQQKQLPEGKFPRFYADESGKTIDATKPVMEVVDTAPVVEPVMSPAGNQLEAPASQTKMLNAPSPTPEPSPSRFIAPDKGPIMDAAAKDPISLIDDLSTRLEQAATPEQRAAIAAELRGLSQSLADPTKPPQQQIGAPVPQAQLPPASPGGTAMANEMATTGKVTALDPQTMKFAQSAPTDQLMQYVEYGEQALASGKIMDPQAFIKAQIQLNTVKNELANRGEGGTFEMMPPQPPVSPIIPTAKSSQYPIEKGNRPVTIDATATVVPDAPVESPVQAIPETVASTPAPAPTPTPVQPVVPPTPAPTPIPVAAQPEHAMPVPAKGKPPKTKTSDLPAPVADPITPVSTTPPVQKPITANSDIGVTLTEVVPKSGKVSYRDAEGVSASYTPEKGEVVFKVGDKTYGAMRKGDKVLISDIVNDPDGANAIMAPFTGDIAGSVSSHLGVSYKPAATAPPPAKKASIPKDDGKTIIPREEPEPKKKVETKTEPEPAKAEPDKYADLTPGERSMFELLDSVEGTSEGATLKNAMDKYYESLETGNPSRRASADLAQAMKNARKISESAPPAKATGSISIQRGQDSAKVLGPNGDTIGSLELVRRKDGTVKVLVFDAKSNKLGDSTIPILNDKALSTIAKEYIGKN